MSKKTALCIVNYSGQAIKSRRVVDYRGFEHPKADLVPLLDGDRLAANDSLCGWVEVDNDGRSPFTFECVLEDGTTLSFTSDQQDARVKHTGVVPHKGNVTGVTVRQVSGGKNAEVWGTNGLYIEGAAPDNASWMRDLLKQKPDVKLNELIMPGSHDAGMYTVAGYMDPITQRDWVVTQGRSIADQLAAGSRYFDLRISQHKGQLYTAHWTAAWGAWGAHLNTVLDDVIAFMNSPQGMDEVVILKFSHTAPSERDLCGPIVKRVTDMIGGAHLLHQAPNDKGYLASAKLRDFTTPYRTQHGSVVAVFDSEFEPFWDATKGVFPYHDVPALGRGLWVYDHYADKDSFEQMWKDQSHKLKLYGGWGNPYQFLLSWTASGSVHTKDVECLAGGVNPYLPRVFRQIEHDGTNRPNIGYIDFLDPYIARVIIDMNR